MNPVVTKLQGVLPGVKTWIERTLEIHRNATISVSNSAYTRLRDHYPEALLVRARVVVVPQVPFPPLSQLGIPELGGMETMPLAGVTYKDTFFVSTGQQSESLYFHELVHVAQWDRLGVDNFLLAYAIGLFQCGYQQSPLEQMAYQLQAAFDQERVPEHLVEFINEQTDCVWDAAEQILKTG